MDDGWLDPVTDTGAKVGRKGTWRRSATERANCPLRHPGPLCPHSTAVIARKVPRQNSDCAAALNSFET